MRVLIDGGYSWSDGDLCHLKSILGAGRIPAGVSVSLLCSPSLARSFRPLGTHIEIIEVGELDGFDRRRHGEWWRSQYPTLQKKVLPDVVFYPSGILRGDTHTVPRAAFLPSLLPIEAREIVRYGFSREAIRYVWLHTKLRRSLPRFEGVIFPSQHALQRTKRLVPTIKSTAVIYHGLDESFKTSLDRTKRLVEPINLLYVSTLFLYKNHDQLVRAFRILRSDYGYDVRLTLVGVATGDRFARARLDRAIYRSDVAPYVSQIGHLDTPSLLEQYQQSDIFVFASSCETFGLPVLEAMGAGLPIACTDSGPMREIVKDGGVYFDVDKPDSIAASISRLIEDAQLRRECSAKARTYAKDYSWERCARETYEFLRLVANRTMDAPLESQLSSSVVSQ